MASDSCRCYHSPRLGLLRCPPCALRAIRESEAAAQAEELAGRVARLASLPAAAA